MKIKADDESNLFKKMLKTKDIAFNFCYLQIDKRSFFFSLFSFTYDLDQLNLFAVRTCNHKDLKYIHIHLFFIFIFSLTWRS